MLQTLQTPDHVAGRWRQAVDAVPGYEVVEDGKIFRTSFLDSFVFSSEHSRALDLLRVSGEMLSTFTAESIEAISERTSPRG